MDNGMAMHSTYGTYHLISHAADGSRRPIICHLGGNRFLTPQQRADRGYPAEEPVENYPSRITTQKSKRKVGRMLDSILSFAGLPADIATLVKGILNTEMHRARLRCCVTATECLANSGSLIERSKALPSPTE